MRTKLFLWTLNASLLAAGGAGLFWHGARTEALRAELSSARAAAHSLALLEEENRRLRVAQPPAEELQALKAEHERLDQLRGELTRLQKLASDRIASAKPTPTAPSARRIWPEAMPELSARAWKNAGWATPAASFETALWAAAGGDVETLASGLCLSEAAPIQALIAELPPEERAKYASPERLIATLMAKDITMQSIQVLDQVTGSNPNEVRLTVRLQASDGAEREVAFNTSRVRDGWKLVVPKVALSHYVNLVRGVTGAPSK